MGRSCSLAVLLISALLLLSSSHGHGRKLMHTSGNEGNSADPSQENAGCDDYPDPGPDINQSGYTSPSESRPCVP